MSNEQYAYDDQTKEPSTPRLLSPVETTQAESNPAFYPKEAKPEAMWTEAERNEAAGTTSDDDSTETPDDSTDEPAEPTPAQEPAAEPAPAEPADGDATADTEQGDEIAGPFTADENATS